MLVFGLNRVVSSYFQVVFKDEVDGVADFSKLVDKAKVTHYIWVNGLDLHVRGCGKGG